MDKWLLSERAGRNVGLDAAIRSYLELGAPAPETAPDVADARSDVGNGPAKLASFPRVASTRPRRRSVPQHGPLSDD